MGLLFHFLDELLFLMCDDPYFIVKVSNTIYPIPVLRHNAFEWERGGVKKKGYTPAGNNKNNYVPLAFCLFWSHGLLSCLSHWL